MKHLIIIGAGGMGRDIYWSAKECIGYGEVFDIKGFLDDDLSSLDGFEGYPPLLGTIDGYQIEEEDVFNCSIGNVKTKTYVCEALKARGAKFYTLINKTAVVHDRTTLGEGCYVGEFALIGTDATIGENCLIQAYSIIGHDCVIGDYVRIDTHSVIIGGVIVQSKATVHTAAVVSHKVVVGEEATVAACSLVIRKVKAGTTVAGNPAKLLVY
jgi:sugar O-acyltransferase (sialic acid O-acetyltransferase NeuD family)